jgi:hypothetical protein
MDSKKDKLKLLVHTMKIITHQALIQEIVILIILTLLEIIN